MIQRVWSVSINMAVVQVKQGGLQGIVCNNNEGKYIAFKGIPYAKPPVGSLRFKAPQPAEPWDGIRHASEHGPTCPQYNERMDRIDVGSEDCLYLNVYTKSISPAKQLPVMVWIHGGAFYTGSGNSDFYGPEFFMSHDVILVTFNYRLEVLGFLCLDNVDVPGNAGLKDQVAALRWVKENIAAFGGDPNNVTIFGCSAGAASTSYHLISKMSEGLFHKAICQSGVCINDWGYNPYAKQRAFQLGKLLGLDTEDPAELLEFLRNVPATSLVNIQLPSLENKHKDITDSIMFGPVIEKSNMKVETFVTETPIDLVRKGKVANVPLIVGYTSGEGIEIARKLPYILDFLSTTGAVVPRELKFILPDEEIQSIDEKIRKHYFRDKPITIDSIQDVSKLEMDKLFVYDIQRFARFHSRNTSAPVYLYKFIAETERNYMKKQYKMESLPGVCHADELHYLFNVTCLDIPLTDESRDIIKRFIHLWTNFATTGNPTAGYDVEPWKQFTEEDEHCYIIGEKCACVNKEDDECIQFWNGIYQEKCLLANHK